jgi:hypothetical protein
MNHPQLGLAQTHQRGITVFPLRRPSGVVRMPERCSPARWPQPDDRQVWGTAFLPFATRRRVLDRSTTAHWTETPRHQRCLAIKAKGKKANTTSDSASP